jgi:hypothetical protein
MPSLPAPPSDIEVAPAEPELTPADIGEMIRELQKDPERIRTFFPRISKATRNDLPEPERPLVMIPMADAWADS